LDTFSTTREDRMQTNRFGLLVLVGALLALGCGPGVRLPGVHEPLDSAEWQRCAGELAERESVGLIDDLTLDSKTMLCKGVALAAEGQVSEGLELLTEAGVRDKADHRPHYLAGRILAENGRFEEALAAFERAQQRFAGLEVPTERLGRQIHEKEGPELARSFLAKANERGLCPYGCRGVLARMYHETGDGAKAKEIYEQMVTEAPDEPAAYVGLAAMHNAAGEYLEESEQLTGAVKAEHFKDLSAAQQADIHYSHAFARYNCRKYKGAAKSIQRALEGGEPRADWYVLAGWIELKQESAALAIVKFEKAVELDGELAAAHTGVGDASIQLGQADEAIAAYEKARALDSGDAVIVLKLAYAVALDGDLDKAAQLVDEASAMDKEHLPPELLGKVTELIER
jgi:tetratricopeptide (TPR) repeat protein